MNEPFIEATKELDHIVEEMKAYFGGGAQKKRARSLLPNKSSNTVATFTPLEEPAKAQKSWADIVSPNDNTRECCEEVFKVRNRVVYQADILRGMNSSLVKLKAAADRLDQEISKFVVKRVTDEVTKQQYHEVMKLKQMLVKVKDLMNSAERNRRELQGMSRRRSRDYPEDPIKKIYYAGLVHSSRDKPRWQAYQSQLTKDRARLIVRSKKLMVETVKPGEGRLRFYGVQPHRID